MRLGFMVLVAAILLVFPASAAAQLQAKEETVSSKTASFRALTIEDVGTGAVSIFGFQGPTFPTGPDADPFEVRLLLVASPHVASAPPAGCRPYFAEEEGVQYGGFSCPPQYDLISIATRGGDDRVEIVEGNYPSLSPKQIRSSTQPVFMNVSLGSGRDSFAGGSGTDFVNAGSGRDRVRGEGGNDVVIGGAGRDLLFGGEGSRDLAVGGGGADRIDGGDGSHDLMIGGRGRDLCRGSGKDRVGGCEKLKLDTSG